MTDAAAQQLADAWRQCQRHAHHLRHAMQGQRLREIRNRFSHDYPDNPDKNAALLNLAFQSVDDVMAILRRIEQKMALPPI